MIHSQFPGEAVGVKVQLLDESGAITDSKKFSLDPEITSFQMLQSLLAKAFDIKGDFVISYLTVDDEEHLVQLSLLNDWDLDAAILNCATQSCLKLIVQKKQNDDGLGDWDVVERGDLPSPGKLDLLGGHEKLVTKLTDKLSSLLSTGRKSKADLTTIKPMKSPMTDAEFRNYLDCSGRLVCEKGFRESVYQGGIEHNLRKVAWRHLLNIFPPDLNGKERYEYLQTKSKEYVLLRNAWKDDFSQGVLTDELKFITSMVRKDVIRTDRTHPFFKGRDDNKNTESLFDLLCTYSTHHPDVSYCQGMSDIASVMLVVQADEGNAYVCFCAIMKRLKSNFLFDGKAMTRKFDHLKLLLFHYDPELWQYMMENETQDLFFTYRWLLLELKREFAFNDSLYMLEVMWSTLPVDLPVNGVPLSDIYCLSADGNQLISKHLAAAQVVQHSSSSCSTPTPYTKLLSLCRKASTPSLTPLGHEPANHILNGCIEEASTTAVDSPRRLSDIPSEHASVATFDLDDSTSLEPINGTVSEDLCMEPNSTFYLTVGEDNNGTLQYTDDSLDNCNEVIESTGSSCSNFNGSCSSADSGIKTSAHTPSSVSQTVSAELQFAFESSDTQKKTNHNSVLPPPDEFGFGNAFLMFAALTMIQQHRNHIIKNKLDFESIAMLFDRKVRRNDVHKIVHQTKLVYENYLKLDKQTYDC